MKRVLGSFGIALALFFGSAASAYADDGTIRQQCRDSSFRVNHQSACAPYYGGIGPARPGGGSGGGGLLGTIGRVLGGLTGGLL